VLAVVGCGSGMIGGAMSILQVERQEMDGRGFTGSQKEQLDIIVESGIEASQL